MYSVNVLALLDLVAPVNQKFELRVILLRDVFEENTCFTVFGCSFRPTWVLLKARPFMIY